MGMLIRAMASIFGGASNAASNSRVGIFSVVHGKRGSLEKLGSRAANTKCAGECTCKCG